MTDDIPMLKTQLAWYQQRVARLENKLDAALDALDKFNFYLLFDSDKDTDTRPVLVEHIRAAKRALARLKDQ